MPGDILGRSRSSVFTVNSTAPKKSIFWSIVNPDMAWPGLILTTWPMKLAWSTDCLKKCQWAKEHWLIKSKSFITLPCFHIFRSVLFRLSALSSDCAFWNQGNTAENEHIRMKNDNNINNQLIATLPQSGTYTEHHWLIKSQIRPLYILAKVPREISFAAFLFSF